MKQMLLRDSFKLTPADEASPRPPFTQLEQTIIRLASHPQEWPLPDTRLARFFWVMRYGANVRPLANSRLEALRLLAACIHSGRHFGRPGAVERIFLDAGWELSDIAAVRSAVRLN